MKRSFLVLVALVAAIMFTACSGEKSEQGDNEINGKPEVSKAGNGQIEMVYFHSDRRCATCKAVEEVSKNTVKDLYGDKVKFSVYNLDTEEGKAKAEELKVPAKALLILSGDNKFDITNEAFLNARSNPSKLKESIKEKIDGLMK
jgi:hypothetical protein